jgi:hypothetical protein
MFMRFITKSFLVGASFFIPLKLALAAELYQFYPACDFEIVDTIKVGSRLGSTGRSVDAQSLANTRKEVINNILDIAQERGVEGVILTKKSVVLDTNSSESKIIRNRVSFTAQLVNNCTKGAALSTKATPFDESGLRRFALNFKSKIRDKMRHTITFKLNNNKQAATAAVDSLNIDFEQGVYGLNLHSTYEDAVALFGQPAGFYALDDDVTLISYGRDFWLTFLNDKLVSVTNENIWFSNELLSMFDFDARFESQKWRILDVASYDMPMVDIEKGLNTQQNSLHMVQRVNASRVISIHGTTKTVERNKPPQYVASYFTYALEGTEQSKLDIALNTHIATMLSQHIYDHVALADVETLRSYSIGQVRSNRDTQLLIMDNHLVVDVTGSTVNKVYLLDSVFSTNQLTTNSPWRFGNLKQGQPVDKVKAFLGDDLFTFDDMIEVSDDKFSQEFLFIDYGDKPRLSSIEVTFY